MRRLVGIEALCAFAVALGTSCSRPPPTGAPQAPAAAIGLAASSVPTAASSRRPSASPAQTLGHEAATLAWGDDVEPTAGHSFVKAIALDGGYVYWSNWVSDLDASEQTLRRMPVGGGAVEVLARGVDARPIVASLGVVFWVESKKGRLMALAGGTGRALLERTSLQPEIAVDAAAVYATTPTELLRVPRGGGAAITLAKGKSIAGVAVDDEAAYFADGSTFWKVPKGGGTPISLGRLPPDTVGLEVALDGERLVAMTVRRGDYFRLVAVPKTGGDPLPMGDEWIRAFDWAPRPAGAREILLGAAMGLYALASPDDAAFAPGSKTRRHSGMDLPTRLLDLGWGEAWAVAADERYAYYAGDHVLRRVPLDRTLSRGDEKCPGGQVPVATGPTEASEKDIDRLDRLGIKRGGGTLLLDDAGGALAAYGPEVFVFSDSRIRAVQVDTRKVRDVAAGVEVADLAADDGTLFWSDTGHDQIESVSTRAGAKPVVVAADRPSPHAIASGGGWVAWVEKPLGDDHPARLVLTRQGGGPVEVVDPEVDRWSSVAIDGAYLYWNGHGPFAMRRPLAGGAMMPIGSETSDLVAHDGRVAWVDGGRLVSIGPDGAMGYSMLYSFGALGRITVDRDTVIATCQGAGKPGIVFAPPDGTCATAGPWLPAVFSPDVGRIALVGRYIVAQLANRLVRFPRH